jgi:hypothetical protein|tara:strand:+ start:2892 stop:3263 length:372 start_codon:yes stop_codon:yes gene_type:complete
MAIVNKIEKKIQVGRDEVIQYQILTYCFFNNIQISMSDLNCLYSLALMEEIELTIFCDKISELGIFKSSQSCRNALSKAEKKGLIVKNGKNKKTILLNPKMDIQIDGTLFLDFKILSVEPKEA